MKKVTKKLSLLEMEQVMTVLTEEEQSMLIGGDSNSLFQAMAMVGQLYNNPMVAADYRRDYEAYMPNQSADTIYYDGAASFMDTKFNVFKQSWNTIVSGDGQIFTFNQSNILFVNYDPTGLNLKDSIVDNIVILTEYNSITGMCKYIDPADRQTKTTERNKLSNDFVYRVDYKS